MKEENNKGKSTFTLASFSKATSSMIATNEQAYRGEWSDRKNRPKVREYSLEEIEKIIDSGSIDAQIQLSRNYFYKNGFYRRILLHYATLLKYTGLLIPNPISNKPLSADFVSKRYFNAINFIDSANLPSFFESCSMIAVRDGGYYGVIQSIEKDNFSVLDLPSRYCASRFKDELGRDIIEFNVLYFDSIADVQARKEALQVYPDVISNYYWNYKKAKNKPSTYWVKIPADIGICFPFLDGRPAFLNMIPAAINYEQAVETDRERDLEEIRKIIVQKIPHLADGGLLFEPEEALEIHKGTVGMMKGNKNVDVLTTYADVDAIVSKTSKDSVSNSLQNSLNNIYSECGVSGQLFGTESNLSLPFSIKNDLALMMTLAHKFENFITRIINDNYANTNINFKYTILPITYYNDSEFMESTFKLANAGYSFLLPALAMGLSQKELSNIKDLETNVLQLDKILVPLSTSYTQSGSSEGAGAPEKTPDEKSPKTVANEKSLDKGGSNNGGTK